jgi:hypothetical protein
MAPDRVRIKALEVPASELRALAFRHSSGPNTCLDRTRVTGDWAALFLHRNPAGLFLRSRVGDIGNCDNQKGEYACRDQQEIKPGQGRPWAASKEAFGLVDRICHNYLFVPEVP